MKQYKLRLTQTQHEVLRRHLLAGDGCEAVAVGLCGRRRGDDVHALSLHTVVPIPYDECKIRTPDRVTWSTKRLVPLLEEAARHDLAVLKIHSHPGGYAQFSEIDDASDADVFASVFGWTDSQYPHCSAIMLPDGRMLGRVILPDGTFHPLDSILIPGDDIHFWRSSVEDTVPEHSQRHAQLFGSETIHRLQQLSIGVVGCSGTGSPVIEQLARLAVGRLVLVDPDVVEDRNLNRILNTKKKDAQSGLPKVEAFARAISEMGLGTKVEPLRENLFSKRAVDAVATCDVLFGCMDGAEGRHLLNRLASYYNLPYFDIGVKLEADGRGGIDEACGAVHYLRPDGSTLLDRRAYTLEQLQAEGLRRTDPEAYRDQLKAGYIHGVREDRPAVISINMQMASLAVNEFLARIHPYRLDPNAESAVVRVNFIASTEHREIEPAASGMFFRQIGRGDAEPPLGVAELSGQGG